MPKTLQEVLGLLDELRALYAKAHDDPQGAGAELRQQIIERAGDLSSSTGQLWPPTPAGGGAAAERHRAVVTRVKAEAEDIRGWAVHNLPGG